MRKILVSLTLIAISALVCEAQTGFQADSAFVLVPRENVRESRVSGKNLKPYNLDYFRSVRYLSTQDQIDKIVEWMLEDSTGAIDKDIIDSNGKTVYMLLRFNDDRPGRYQYLGFQRKPLSVPDKAPGQAYVTMVYMRGKATPEELSKIFKHREVK